MPIQVEDIEYRRDARGALLARHYRPEGRGPFPAVLEVHGGAWTGGDRLNNTVIGEYLAQNGVAVLSIDFRMPPEARYPETVADVNFGIRFLKANTARFATRAMPRSRSPASRPGSPLRSRAGRWPIRSHATRPCANAVTIAWSTRIINSGLPRKRWRKAARR